MNYSVLVTPTAEANLDEILHFIALDNPKEARRFIEGLRAKMATLANMPKRCGFAPENGLDGLEIRQLIYGNYRILFTIAESRVIVLQVRHGARKQFSSR